jgi:hypothetical protein
MLKLAADDRASLERVVTVLADEAKRGGVLAGTWAVWRADLQRLVAGASAAKLEDPDVEIALAEGSTLADHLADEMDCHPGEVRHKALVALAIMRRQRFDLGWEPGGVVLRLTQAGRTEYYQLEHDFELTLMGDRPTDPREVTAS